MLKALMRKQFSETVSFMFMSGKAGKRRSVGGMIGYGVLMLYVLACFGFIFFASAGALCKPLVSMGLDWLYFALMGIMATAMGVIGSVFTTQSKLYEAKDNELLLSMPIPSRLILLSRLLGLFGQALVFELLVLLPAAAVYIVNFGMGFSQIIIYILICLLLPLFTLGLSCILGWLTALASSRMRNKSLVSMILSIGFLCLYFYAYSKINTYLQLILVNSEAVGATVKKALYPLYQMGMAAAGSWASLLIFAALVLVFFALIYLLLSVSFIRIATGKRGAAKIKYSEKPMKRSSQGAAKIKYSEKPMKRSSQGAALLKKEALRFWSSPTYMMNCSLGSIMMLIGTVVLVVKLDDFRPILAQIPSLDAALPLLTAGAIALIGSMNVVTAPSISLEGKTLWLTQSLPVSGWQVLKSKLTLHMLITAVPAFVCMLVLAVVLKVDPVSTLLLLVFSVIYVLLCAALGLMINLKLPNLNWTNETVAVKQSASVIVAMLANWGIAFLLIIGYIFLGAKLSQGLFLLLCTLLSAAASALALLWLKKRGQKILAHL